METNKVITIESSEPKIINCFIMQYGKWVKTEFKDVPNGTKFVLLHEFINGTMEPIGIGYY